MRVSEIGKPNVVVHLNCWRPIVEHFLGLIEPRRLHCSDRVRNRPIMDMRKTRKG